MLAVGFLVVLRVHELGDDLSGMSGGVEVVGVLVHLLLGALLAAVAGEDVLVVVKVVVVVLVKESFGHIYVFILVNIDHRNIVFVAVTTLLTIWFLLNVGGNGSAGVYIACQRHVTDRMRVDKILGL